MPLCHLIPIQLEGSMPLSLHVVCKARFIPKIRMDGDVVLGSFGGADFSCRAQRDMSVSSMRLQDSMSG